MNNIAIIDIGSNSVRLRISSDEKVLLRQTLTTQLSRDIKDQKLSYSSINRTLEGISEFVNEIKRYNATPFAFATAAVRNSQNGNDFCRLFNEKFGFNVDVISGEQEAELALLGALNGKNGSVIDVGGASSELAVTKNGTIAYSHSMPNGAVTLTDKFGKNLAKSKEFLNNYIATNFKNDFLLLQPLVLIGGTATSLAYIANGCGLYNRDKNNGKILTLQFISNLTQELFALSSDEVAQKYSLNPKRAQVIHSGCLIIEHLLKHYNQTQATVSENDNLEGYYLYKIKGVTYGK